MANVAEIYTITTQAAYLSAGVKEALEGLLRFLPPALKQSDNLAFYANNSVSTAPVDIDTGSGSRPVVVVVESRGTAGWVRLYNAVGSASVTGSDEFPDVLTIPVATTTGEVTTVYYGGNSFEAYWGTGLVVATATTAAGNARAVMTNLPRIYMLYVNA